MPLRAQRQARLATKAAVKTDSSYTAEARVSAGSHLPDRRPPCELLRELSLCACRHSSSAAMEQSACILTARETATSSCTSQGPPDTLEYRLHIQQGGATSTAVALHVLRRFGSNPFLEHPADLLAN